MPVAAGAMHLGPAHEEAPVFLLGRRFNLYRSQVRSRLESPAHKHELFVDVLSGLRVGDHNDWEFANYAAWFVGWAAGAGFLTGLLAMAMNTARAARRDEAVEKEASRG